jgi:general stress protein 26
MTKEDVIDLIKDAGYCILATADEGVPKVRPMMPYLNEDGNLLAALLSHARMIPQIQKNPHVELCFVDRKMCFARIAGKAVVSADPQKKEIVWNNIPMLRQYFSSPEDPNFILVEIFTDTIEAMSPQQPRPDRVSLH